MFDILFNLFGPVVEAEYHERRQAEHQTEDGTDKLNNTSGICSVSCSLSLSVLEPQCSEWISRLSSATRPAAVTARTSISMFLLTTFVGQRHVGVQGPSSKMLHIPPVQSVPTTISAALMSVTRHPDCCRSSLKSWVALGSAQACLLPAPHSQAYRHRSSADWHIVRHLAASTWSDIPVRYTCWCICQHWFDLLEGKQGAFSPNPSEKWSEQMELTRTSASPCLS